MTRKYSSISTQTTLASSISSTATSITVAASSGTTLMGGQSLAVGFVDQFTLVIDPDTANEEVVFATAIASDTLTIVRGRAGTAGITHSSGAVVKHVLTSDDLAYFTAGVDASATLTGTQTLTNKTLTTPVISTITNTGTITLPTTTDTLVGKATTDTFTNKTFDTAGTGNSFKINGTAITANTGTGSNVLATSPTLATALMNNSVFAAPQERLSVSATAATGTINFDASTQGIVYYTANATANWTLNIRGTSSVTLNSLLAVNDSITVIFMNTNGTTAYYGSALTIDGTSVTPKYSGGTAFAAGNASSIDIYTYTIVKTASATFTVFASQSKFA